MTARIRALLRRAHDFVDVHISNLRRKLGRFASLVEAQKDVGYRLRPDVLAS